MADKPLAIFLMGPTASGKTDLAVELVQRLPVEIISVDSALIYRHMDIGTAKPEKDILDIAPHRLIDICEPTASYSAANFRQDALAAMQEIQAKGKTPLLVGGTMLYFKALEHGLAELPASDPVVRQRLQQEADQQGLELMHQRLEKIDPKAAARIHKNDPQRVLRALEVYELSGNPLSKLLAAQQDTDMPFQAIKFIRAPADRAVLHQRIEQRFDQMLAQGFEQEVSELMEITAFTPRLPAMRSVGYRQMIAYLQGESSFDVMREKGIIATRQLAKRQFTWLRKETEATWLGDDMADLAATVMNIVNI